jgi:hypothetical protein
MLLCTLMDAGKDNMYATGLIFSNISKCPQYLAANFGQLPNLSELPFAFTFKNTCSPTLKSLKLYSCLHNFSVLSWEAFKFCFIFVIYSSIFFNKYGPTTALSTGLSQLMGVLHFCHTMLQMDSFSMRFHTHCCRKIQLNEYNLPTLMVDPSHTF